MLLLLGGGGDEAEEGRGGTASGAGWRKWIWEDPEGKRTGGGEDKPPRF